MLPFDDMVLTVKLTGHEVKQVLEDALTNFLDNGGSTGSYPYAAGLRFEVGLCV
jgi:5'-nucleotidase